MKCRYCLAPLEITEPYCPTCGKKNPLAVPGQCKCAQFRLDDDPEIKTSSLNRPSTPNRSCSHTYYPATPPKKQTARKPAAVLFTVLFIFVICFIILSNILSFLL